MPAVALQHWERRVISCTHLPGPSIVGALDGLQGSYNPIPFFEQGHHLRTLQPIWQRVQLESELDIHLNKIVTRMESLVNSNLVTCHNSDAKTVLHTDKGDTLINKFEFVEGTLTIATRQPHHCIITVRCLGSS